MNYFDEMVDESTIHHCFNAAHEITLTGNKESFKNNQEVSDHLRYELGVRAFKFLYKTEGLPDDQISLTYAI